MDKDTFMISFTLEDSFFVKRVTVTKDLISNIHNQKKEGKTIPSIFKRQTVNMSVQPIQKPIREIITLFDFIQMDQKTTPIRKSMVLKVTGLPTCLWFQSFQNENDTINQNPFVKINTYFQIGDSIKDLPSMAFRWDRFFNQEQIKELTKKQKLFCFLCLEWLESYQQKSFWSQNEKEKNFNEQITQAQKKESQSKEIDSVNTTGKDIHFPESSFFSDVGNFMDFEMDYMPVEESANKIDEPSLVNHSSSSSMNLDSDGNSPTPTPKLKKVVKLINPDLNELPTLKPKNIIDISNYDETTRYKLHFNWCHRISFPHYSIPSPLIQMVLNDEMPLLCSTLMSSTHINLITFKSYLFSKIYPIDITTPILNLYMTKAKLVMDWYRDALKYLYLRHKHLLVSNDGTFIKITHSQKGKNLFELNLFTEEFMLIQQMYHTRWMNLQEVFAYQVFLGLTEKSPFDSIEQKQMNQSQSFSEHNLTAKLSRFAPSMTVPLQYPNFQTNVFKDTLLKESTEHRSSDKIYPFLTDLQRNVLSNYEQKYTSPLRTKEDSFNWGYLLTPDTYNLMIPYSGRASDKEDDLITESDQKLIKSKLFNIIGAFGAIFYKIVQKCKICLKANIVLDTDLNLTEEVKNTLKSVIEFIEKPNKDGLPTNPWLNLYTEMKTSQKFFIPKIVSVCVTTVNDILQNMVCEDLENMNLNKNEKEDITMDKLDEFDDFLKKPEKIKLLESFSKNYEKSSLHIDEISQPSFEEDFLENQSTNNVSKIQLMFPELGFDFDWATFANRLTLQKVKHIYYELLYIYFSMFLGNDELKRILQINIPEKSKDQINDLCTEFSKSTLRIILMAYNSWQTDSVTFYQAALTVQSHLIFYCTGMEMKVIPQEP